MKRAIWTIWVFSLPFGLECAKNQSELSLSTGNSLSIAQPFARGSAVLLCAGSLIGAAAQVPPAQLPVRVPPALYARQVVEAREVDRKQWAGELVIEELAPIMKQAEAAAKGNLTIDQFWALWCSSNVQVTLSGGDEKFHRQGSGTVLRRFEVGPGGGQRVSKIGEALGQYRGRFESIARIDAQVTEIALATNESRRLATVTMEVRVAGKQADGNRADRFLANCTFQAGLDSAKWQLAKLRLTRKESLTGPRLFKEQTNGLPVFAPRTNLGGFDVGYFAEGVSVADFDVDGDLDIILPARNGPLAILENDGHARFTDAAPKLGLGTLFGSRAAYLFDFDNDGDLDLLVLTQERLWLFEKEGGEFIDISEKSDFHRMFTDGLVGAAISDFDNDGMLDFYLCNYGDPRNTPGFDYFDSKTGYFNKLFRNEGAGKFKDVTAKAGLDEDNRRWTYAAIWIDFDDDRAPDLYVVNDYGPNQLFRNDGAGGFQDVALAKGAEDFGSGMGVAWGDYDGDGLLDLYVSNMHSYPGERLARLANFSTNSSQSARAARFSKGNTLLRNIGNGFREVPNSGTEKAGWAWGTVFFDYDNDGDQDIYVANGMYSKGENDAESIFWRQIISPIANLDPQYRRGSVVLGYSMMIENASFSGRQRNCLFENFGPEGFEEVGAVAGANLIEDSRGVAAGDLDSDGDLDLVVSNRSGPPLTILENTLPIQNGYIRVRLRGTKSNRMGIGARVTLVCKGKTQVQDIVAGSGFASQSPPEAWFGVGTSRKIDSLKIDWPSGAISTQTGIPVGQTVSIIEPGE